LRRQLRRRKRKHLVDENSTDGRKIKPIRNGVSGNVARKEIERFSSAKLSALDGDRLEVLVILVDLYEKKYFPTREPGAISTIEFCMRQMGINRKDL
jgi:HTH-type transcriptional regulator/antitoxin HigA